ncbi:MAG: ABC transporter ATP-binding protein [Planctomycetes bacterium]|nr:ABC transporter ATP-binding protein [Planctomycetota bacterium]
MSMIGVNNLSFAYTETELLKKLSFEIEQGSFLAIAGPNGAGKSTLLNLLSGTLKPKTGKITINDKPIESYSTKTLAQKIAVVRQEFVPIFGFTVAQSVMMARTTYYGQLGFESKADREIVTEALELTDTAQFSSRPLTNLSGGERQCVFIARAFAQDTPILLLDEPTSFLDLKHQVDIYDLLKNAQIEKGKTIITVTHDINLASQYADTALLISADGSYHIGKVKDVFLPEQIEKVFDVKTFYGTVGKENFFLPLGKFAKDNQVIQ